MVPPGRRKSLLNGSAATALPSPISMISAPNAAAKGRLSRMIWRNPSTVTPVVPPLAVPSGLTPSEYHDEQGYRTQRRPDRVQPSPGDQKLPYRVARAVKRSILQATIGREGNDHGKRHHRADEKTSNEPSQSTAAPPAHEAEKRPDDGQGGLHQGSAPVARSPLRQRHRRVAGQPRRVLDKADINGRPGENRRRRHGKTLNR